MTSRFFSRAAPHLLLPDFAVLIPAYNEAATIVDVVKRCLAHASRVIVVDDGSTDDTAALLQDLPVTVLRNGENQGKAASLWRGAQQALAAGARFVITLDGDGQHAPEEIPALAAMARRHPAHIIIGSRLWNKHVFPRARYNANRFANFWIAWASGQPIEDSQSGFRVYPADLLRKVRTPHHKQRCFVFESEIIIEAARLGYYSLPVNIQTNYPPAARPSHFRPVLDITRIVGMVAWKLAIRLGDFPGLYRSLKKQASLSTPPRSRGRRPGKIVGGSG